MAGNKDLNQAKEARKDEFYTMLPDIENELRHYKKHFAGKTVLCNCDDPFESNFFKYFVLNFNRLGLRKLIATCYTGSPIANQQLSLFDVLGDTEENENKPYKAIVTTVYDKTGDGGVDMLDVAELFKSGENELTELKGDGDFRSPECLELMDEADIVVTNPPFSLFREYVNTLVKKGKKFIVLGSMNAITYKDVFSLLISNDLWAGYGFNLSMVYKTPYPNTLEANRKFVQARGFDPDDGYVKVPGITWFTNLDIKKRHEDMILVRRYSTDAYLSYDNYDAIDVGSLSDIPCDYAGKMGVPVTYLDVYNPDQFEIIGFGKGELAKSIGVQKNYRGRSDLAYTDANGKKYCPFGRIVIRNKHPEAPKEG